MVLHRICSVQTSECPKKLDVFSSAHKIKESASGIAQVFVCIYPKTHLSTDGHVAGVEQGTRHQPIEHLFASLLLSSRTSLLLHSMAYMNNVIFSCRLSMSMNGTLQRGACLHVFVCVYLYMYFTCFLRNT